MKIEFKDTRMQFVSDGKVLVQIKAEFVVRVQARMQDVKVNSKVTVNNEGEHVVIRSKQGDELLRVRGAIDDRKVVWFEGEIVGSVYLEVI